NGHGLSWAGELAWLLFHRLLSDADERLTIAAIQEVAPAGLTALVEALACDAVVDLIEKHDRAGSVVVPDLVMLFLEVPLVRAGLVVKSDDRGREQVVTGPDGAVRLGAGVAGAEVQHAELGVDSDRLPDGRAAVCPGLCAARVRVIGRWPRVAAEFAR